MKKIALIFSILPLTAFAESDAEIALNNAMDSVRTNCSGVSARMENIKKMAGIGTAVNAVGTASGVGGVVSGVIKQKTDLEMAHNMGEKEGIDVVLSKLKEKASAPENQAMLNQKIKLSPGVEKELNEFATKLSNEEKEEEIKNLEQRSEELQNEISKQQQKSTTAGNVRTGMFAIDTVSNVAGAVVSSKTVVGKDFIEQIKLCTESIHTLRDARTRAKVEDGGNIDQKKMEVSQKMLDKCSEYEYVNLTPLNNLGKGAMVANSVGAVTGATATITSVLGNNKKLSNMDFTTVEGAQEIVKYEKVNKASNVLGGVTAAASLTGTVLNASQIKEAKKILNIASECEETLQW